MHSFRIWTALICFGLFGSLCPAVGQAADTDWSKPETIDPYDKELGGFLDFDLEAAKGKALEAYQAAEYEDAARYYLVALRHDIMDGMSTYNLACCYGLLGRADLAAIYVERAYRRGFEDIGHIKQDTDFDRVRDDQAFKDAIAHIEELQAQKPQPQGFNIYTRFEKYIRCRVRLPDNYDPAKAYPLVLGLHGLGASPESFINLWNRFGDDPQFIYASPEAPYPFVPGDKMGYSWQEWMPEDKAASDGARTLAEEYVVNVISELRECYRIGDVWLMGFSQGGMMTYCVGLKHPKLFKGIMPFGGWLDSEWIGEDAIEAAKGLPVFIGHGSKDPVVDPKRAEEAEELLKQHGFDVTLLKFDGVHEVPEELLKAAREWMER
jgi:phospholipase/carboxylesterase